MNGLGGQSLGLGCSSNSMDEMSSDDATMSEHRVKASRNKAMMRMMKRQGREGQKEAMGSTLMEVVVSGEDFEG